MGFYSVKGIAALVGLVLLVVHAYRVRRSNTASLGQWLRYLTLLYVAVLMTGASLSQFASDAAIEWYNAAALGAPLLLILAMLVSISEDRRKR